MSAREAMQQALEALNLPSMKTMPMLRQRDKAIATLRAALEQPEQDPVALIRDGVLRWHIPHEHYARPAWTAHGTHMLYAQPPQRKPLTVDEVWQNDELMSLNEELGCNMDLLVKVVRAIEAAHGIGEKP